ncbi:nose resistant to fluoxetine protein 6-like isoform X2 [Macrosteles quadrilineatus]|uniref:nose resistant to fluoxetine protein 6-like isoform X2 n=1 Tax=Macrosteles quadrilineatus TaxID=74068 RepID=UPI0023E1514C|nr:nose resistant to fluoxetine protein 6-like isoform X2 [Macrosteles quadrilineatus]
MVILFYPLALMLCNVEVLEAREKITQVISRFEPQLRERAKTLQKLAFPIPEAEFEAFVKEVVTQRVPINAETEQCREDSQHLLDSIIGGETWALHMLDASTKLPSGILDGRFIDSGVYSQCVRVEEPNQQFKGQHCLVEIRNVFPKELHLLFNYDLSNVPREVVGVLPHAKDLAMSVCVPSSCSARDVQVHMDHVLASINASSVIYETSCSTNQPIPFSFMERVLIILFLGVVILVCWATVKDAQPTNKSVLASSFSLRRSWRQLTDSRTSSEEVSCMAGVRVFFTVSTVFIHCFLKRLWDSSLSPLIVEQELGSWHILWIEFGIRSPEVFFLFGGITRTLGFLRERAKEKPFQFGADILRRYFRYTPTLAVVMIFSANFLMRCGSGPFWTRQSMLSAWGCRNLWFTGLLHISNLLYPRVACVQHSWYLSIDFQLFLISPLFLLQLHYDPPIGMLLIAAVAAASIFTNFLAAVATSVDAPSLAIMYKNRMGNEIVSEIYFSTPYRTFPYLLGLTLGYFIFTMKQDKIKVKIPKLMRWLGWSATTLVMSTLLVVCHVMLDPSYERVAWFDVGYTVLGKPMIALSAAWVVMACHLGYGGLLNNFLSWPGFQPFSRLALGIYLVHFEIIRIQGNRLTRPVEYDNFYFFHIGIGVLMVSTFVAVVLYLCVEAPCYNYVSHYLRNIPANVEDDKTHQLVKNGSESHKSNQLTSMKSKKVSGRLKIN